MPSSPVECDTAPPPAPRGRKDFIITRYLCEAVSQCFSTHGFRGSFSLPYLSPLCHHHHFLKPWGATESEKQNYPRQAASKGLTWKEPRRFNPYGSFWGRVDVVLSVKSITPQGKPWPKTKSSLSSVAPSACPDPPYLHVSPGNEALALHITGLEEFLCLSQHSQLAGYLLLGQAGPAPLQAPARTPGLGVLLPVRTSHPDL